MIERSGRRSRSRLTVAVSLTLGISLVLAACASGPSPERAAGRAATTREAPVGTTPGRRAPDFTITTTSGEVFGLSEQRGRAVVLAFLAVGCPSCAAEVPALKTAWEIYRDRGLVVLVVDVSGASADEVVSYYREELKGGDHPYAVDEGFRVARLYRIIDSGQTFVINRDGTVGFVDIEPTSADVLDQEVRKALG